MHGAETDTAIPLPGFGPIRSWDHGDLESAVLLLRAIHPHQELHSDAEARDLWCWSRLWISLPHRGIHTWTVITRPLSTLCFPQNWTSPLCMLSLYEAETRFHLCPAQTESFRTFCLRREHEIFSYWNQMWGNVKWCFQIVSSYLGNRHLLNTCCMSPFSNYQPWQRAVINTDMHTHTHTHTHTHDWESKFVEKIANSTKFESKQHITSILSDWWNVLKLVTPDFD